MKAVYSKNADYQQFDALRRNRRKRSQLGLAFVESVQAINAAIKNDVPIHTAIIDSERRLSSWGERVVRSAKSAFELTPALMAELSERDEPSEVIVLVEMPSLDVETLATNDRFIWVVCDRPASEGNLGSVIRSCDALGADAILTTGHGVDLFDPLTIRASLGAVFNRPVGHLEMPELKQLLATVPDATILGTSAKASMDLDAIEISRPTVLLLGNETAGLSRSLTEICTAIGRIPMEGIASSLNVGAAAAIALYEIARQTR